MHASPQLTEFSEQVADSGEGRWTAITAIGEAVPTPVLTAALYSRFSSRHGDTFADKVLSALRQQFGGYTDQQPQGGDVAMWGIRVLEAALAQGQGGGSGLDAIATVASRRLAWLAAVSRRIS